LTGKEGKMMGFAETLHEERNGFLLSDDPALIDADRVHVWISEESYWANGRSKELMNRALEGSHVIGVYRDGEQVAICRIVSDGATFAWLCDIFVDASVRGKGIGTWISQSAVDWATSQGIKRMVLATRDAHDVYARAGFAQLEGAARWMEIDTRPQRVAILGAMSTVEDAS
jgi:GNAT superfamily N-acetyltransferase